MHSFLLNIERFFCDLAIRGVICFNHLENTGNIFGNVPIQVITRFAIALRPSYAPSLLRRLRALRSIKRCWPSQGICSGADSVTCFRICLAFSILLIPFHINSKIIAFFTGHKVLRMNYEPLVGRQKRKLLILYSLFRTIS
jgi:hypothetical protein